MTITRQHGFGFIGCIILMGALCMGPIGCMKYRKGPDMAARIVDAPPIRIETTEEVHLLVMQAPHPGWTFTLDHDEVIPEGKRVYITIRRPDPTMMYPQVIVEKQLLTLVHADTPIEIHARLLGYKESTKRRRYAQIDPVDSFED